MIKRSIAYLLGFVIILVSTYSFHTSFLKKSNYISILLKESYIYFTSFTLILCLGLLLLKFFKKLEPQLGFLYLLSVPLKIIGFYTIFKEIFSQGDFYLINLLVPMALTLVFEVFLISKLLNKLSAVKNAK